MTSSEVEYLYDDPDAFPEASLHRERLCVLCACALTCKAMLRQARFHLYGRITLIERSRVSSFARTLAVYDDLALMVKHLPFGLADFVSRSEDDDRFDMPFPPHVVARLSNLQSLEIGGAEFSSLVPPAALDFAKISMFAAACPSPGSIFTPLRTFLTPHDTEMLQQSNLRYDWATYIRYGHVRGRMGSEREDPALPV
ncbi:hypothetical protein C8Q74DRAFT_1257398 [Fomes fomentarius]|nr:hypothetical protein C8Q74DRAFT_1257398 [Fomes fomentarius]